ncbi:MAG: RNA methyltransferase substrate-binding domain-containing protein, partial [Peptostreptococcaceae bacterium]
MAIMITAKENEKVKYTKSLLKSKYRNKESKFVIEWFRIVTLAIECNADLDYIFINEDFENKDEHIKFLGILNKKNIKIYKTTNKIFNELVDTESTQGILGVVKFKSKDIETSLNDENRFVLNLDRI